jgi:hypothetical protein
LDNHSWFFIHGCCVQDWCHIPILLTIDRVVEGSNGQNLTKGIMDIFMVVNGLAKVEIPKRLLCFGANSVSTF